MAQTTSEPFDVTARKFHQITCVGLLVLAYVLEPLGPGFRLPALALVSLVGIVLALGRFWWPADIFRQIAWRVLEPSGLLKRQEAVEDHATRRIARVLGGGALLASAGLLAAGQPWGWVLVGLMALMIFLDGAFDY